MKIILRADSWFAPSQWETALLCNDVSHWLGANLESVLILIKSESHLPVVNESNSRPNLPFPGFPADSVVSDWQLATVGYVMYGNMCWLGMETLAENTGVDIELGNQWPICKVMIYYSLHLRHINGLVQEIHYSSASAMELCLSCTNPSIWWLHEMETFGPLWGESTSHQWIHLTKASDMELWWTNGWENNWDTGYWGAITLIMTSL